MKLPHNNSHLIVNKAESLTGFCLHVFVRTFLKT